MPFTIRKILNIKPRKLEVAIFATLEVEVINKENDKMLRRAKEPIFAFIPFYHHFNKFLFYPINFFEVFSIFQMGNNLI